MTMMNSTGYNKNYVFSAACAGMLLFGIVMISLGSILPEVTDKFQLNDAQAGILLTLLPSGILLGSLVFGPLADWLSYKHVLVSGSILTFIGLEGLVFTELSSVLHLSVLCIGAGGGMLNGITNSLVSAISEEDHSANLSVLGVFFGVGALLTPVVLGSLKGIYDFEWIFTWLGLLIVLPVLFFLLIRFPKSTETMGVPIKPALKMVKDPLLLLFGFILFFQSGIEGLTNNWTTTYLENVKEINAANALFLLSSFVGALTVARIVLGKILRIFIPFQVLLVSLLVTLAGCFSWVFGSTYFVLIIGVVCIGTGLAAGFPVVLGYIGQTYTQFSSTAFSIAITIALIGNVVTNFVMGQVSEYYGVKVLPYFMIVELVIVIVILQIVRNKYQNKLNKNSNNVSNTMA